MRGKKIQKSPEAQFGKGLIGTPEAPLPPPLTPFAKPEIAADPTPGPFHTNNNIQGMLLYMLGYYYLLSGNKTLALKVSEALQGLDENLARLLQSKIKPSR